MQHQAERAVFKAENRKPWPILLPCLWAMPAFYTSYLAGGNGKSSISRPVKMLWNSNKVSLRHSYATNEKDSAWPLCNSNDGA